MVVAAVAPVFRRFLPDACADVEQMDLCLQMIAWFMTWDNSLKKIFYLYGDSDTGKSVLVNDVITPLIGDDLVSNIPLEAFGTRFGEMPLRGKKLNVSSEARFVDSVVAERLKAISGGDKTTQDVKNQKPVTYPPTVHLLGTGNLPAKYQDDVIWGRQHVLHFNNVVPRDRQDRQLGEKLRAELPGIFRLVMLAWLRLRRRGDFVRSRVSEELVQQFRLRSNPPKMFFEECFVADDVGSITREDVMHKFKQFCTRWSYKGGHSRESVFDVLRRQFPWVREGWETARSRRHRVFIGVRYAPGDECNRAEIKMDSLVVQAAEHQQEAEKSARKCEQSARRAKDEAAKAEAAANRKLQQAAKRRKALEDPKELKRQCEQILRVDPARRLREKAKREKEKAKREKEKAKREKEKAKQKKAQEEAAKTNDPKVLQDSKAADQSQDKDELNLSEIQGIIEELTDDE